MSSLEERRAARAARRRRQEDNDDMKTSVLSADLEERLAQRRRDREERLKLIAAGVSTINGEDEFERRRRERREQRLRGEDEAQEETTSRRSRRRQVEEEEEDSTSSYRSRRRRGGDDEDSYSAPAEPAYDEEAENRRRQQQEEEEAAARAAQEEYERQQEELRRQRQEEERQRREEEERRQRKKERIEEQEPQRYQKALQERKKLETRPASDTNGDTADKGVKAENSDRWSKNSFSKSIEVRRISEEGKAGKLKSFFETKEDPSPKSNGLPPQPVKRQSSIKSPAPIEPIEDNSLNLVQEQLVKFETSMHLHHTPKIEPRKHREIEIKIIAQGADRLKDIQKKFQGENNMMNGNTPRLGKFSSSEQHINEKTESWRESPTVLNRWNHQQTDLTKRTYRSTSSISLNLDNNASEQVRRKSEKIALLTAKIVDKGDKGEVTSPLSPREGSSLRRKWSLSSDTSSDTTDSVVTRWRARNSVSKLTDRWQHDQASSPNNSFTRSPRPWSSFSPEQNKENRLPTVRRSNSLNLDRSYTGRLEEEERLRLEREEQEREEAQAMIDEEARIEQEKLDAERIKKEKLEQAERDREEEERQKLIETEARRMAEEQKKKKKKGLGGLSPEKKKMLKKLIMQKAAEDLKNEAKAKAEAKEKYINDLVPKFSTDGKDVAALQSLCKDFHKRLAALEEDVYDWEAKIRKQDFEINELTLKVNDTKGKFVKPVLRKVNKTESKLDKIQRKEAKKSDFRDNLKSSSKHAEDGGEEGEAEAE